MMANTPETVTSVDETRTGQLVDGWTAPEFAGVRTAFESNLRVGDDLGAAVSVYRFGECVVDLWGGRRDDAGARYPQDALQLVFSTTKGLLALCLTSLVEERALELDASVADYWPEFAANGKAAITVRQLASHQAGLPAFDGTISLQDLGDWQLCVSRLAEQAPCWEPGSAHGYHAVTIGYLVGELIRRASGQTVGALFRERFGVPLSLDAWIGLPDDKLGRVVPLVEPTPSNGVGAILADAEAAPETLTHRALANPPVNSANFNDATVFAPEIPGVNGITDARSLARLYSTVVDGPLRRFSPAVVDEMRTAQVDGPDLVLVDQPTRFGVGFMLAAPREPMLGPGSFGHNGRGGSLAFAHPESGIAYGFVANRMVIDPAPDRRNARLLSAVFESLA